MTIEKGKLPMIQTWKVDLVWERDWNLGLVGRTLNELGYLGTLYGGFPRYRYLRLGIPNEKIQTKPAAALWNYGIGQLKLPTYLQMSEPKRMGEWVARQRQHAPAVLVNGTAYRFLFPKILDRPILRIVERGSMFPEDFFRFPQKARQEAGYSYQNQLPLEIVDEMKKAHLAHATICGSDMVRQSYVTRGFNPKALYTAHYGVKMGRQLEAGHEDPAGRNIRVGWLGVIGFRKGLDRARRISEWASQRSIPLEFHFVGPIQDSESHEILRKFLCPYVLHGVQKGAELEKIIQNWDIYIQPSYEEGFPISLLIAMSAGVPAVVSHDTGACEAIRDGIDGVVLSEYTPEYLDHKLAALVKTQSLRVESGFQAKKRISENFTVSNYMERIKQIHLNLQKEGAAWGKFIQHKSEARRVVE